MKNKKLLRQRRNAFWSALYAAVIYALFYIPVLVMIQFSFNDAKRNYSWEGFTTQWYGKLFSFGNHDLWESLVYSLAIAVAATVISVVVGVLGGIGLKKFEFRGKKFINLMLYVPIVVPEIVLAVSMLIILPCSSSLNRAKPPSKYDLAYVMLPANSPGLLETPSTFILLAQSSFRNS